MMNFKSIFVLGESKRVARGRMETICCARCKNFISVDKLYPDEYPGRNRCNDKYVFSYRPERKMTYFFASKPCICPNEIKRPISLTGWYCNCGFMGTCIHCYLDIENSEYLYRDIVYNLNFSF